MKYLSSGSFGCTPRGVAHQLGHEFRRHDGLEVEILSQESSSSCFVTWLILRSLNVVWSTALSPISVGRMSVEIGGKVCREAESFTVAYVLRL